MRRIKKQSDIGPEASGGDEYKVKQLQKMLAHETSESETHYGVSAPVQFCNFSPNVECKKMAGKGMQPLNNYTCRFRPSSLKCTDKSGLDGLQTDK